MLIHTRQGGLALLLLVSASTTVLAQTTVNPRAMAQIPLPNPETAEAQSGNLLEGQGVLDRARPEYDAAGVSLGGGMTLYPTLAVDVAGDDNVFRGPVASSDAIWTISPRLDLRTNWDSNALQ